MSRLLSPVNYTRALLVVGVLFLVNCDHALTSDDQHCNQYQSSSSSSSCGNIHNISYPFRFQGDPPKCGNKRYELSCENNRPVLNLLGGGKYYVQGINYKNYTIRLVDVGLQIGNCSSLPLYSLSYQNFTSIGSFYDSDYYYDYYGVYPHDLRSLEAVAVFVDCENPVNSPLYMDTANSTAAAYSSNCINKVSSDSSSSSSSSSSNSLSSSSSSESGYSYFLFGNLRASDVANLCRIEEIVISTLGSPSSKFSSSFLDFHRELASGFELSWVNILCEKCTRRGSCYINPTDYTVTCYKYCSPQFKLTFLCALERIANNYVLPSLKIIGFILGARTFCGMLCLFAFLFYKFWRRHLSMFDTIEGFLQSQNNLMPIRYSYWDIRKMTKGFKDKLGEGGYGCVYKGKLRSDYIVAIKILGKPKSNGQDFINEVATIGRIHHVNVVQLIGFCAEGSKRALVYDFMPNGSLEKYIFSEEGNLSLSCKQMYEISLGVARGIEYLHRGCDMQILHFDIKPHNILLDGNFTPKVSDFGLAKLYSTNDSIVSLTAARGTMGYMAPELFYKNLGPFPTKLMFIVLECC